MPDRQIRRDTSVTHDDLLLIGPLPPPVSGFSVITDAFHKEMEARLPVTVVDAAVSQKYPRLIYHSLRLLRCFLGCAYVIIWHISGKRALYVACNGSNGILYSALLMFVARVLKGPIYLHHHSFEYILDDNPHMRRLLRWTSKRVVHIFLCEAMLCQFQNRYGPVESVVLENAAFVPIPEIQDQPKLRPGKPDTVIGLISNLNREKGLYNYLELLRTARAEGLPVRGLLAGPATGADLLAINSAVADADMGLTYLGGVYGAAKDQFYRNIDIFYFPTEYRTEAQPTVIFEAQSYGVPVISRGMGCVTCQLPMDRGLIFTTEDTLEQAMMWLRAFLEPKEYSGLREESRRHFLKRRREAIAILDSLAERIGASAG